MKKGSNSVKNLKKLLSGLLSIVMTVSVFAADGVPVFAAGETAALGSPTDVWDGQSQTEPKTGNGTDDNPYIITNGAELAWLAKQVVTTNGRFSAILNNNIDLGEKAWEGETGINGNKWQAIGKYGSPYVGIFDGNGKVISGLSGSKGLFDLIGEDATVKNLTVTGDITGTGNVGGIADSCSGRIENVMFKGNVTNSDTYSTGGIAGRLQTGGSMTGCVSMGSVTNTSVSYGSAVNTGGLAGYSYVEIKNSYSLCTVSADASRGTNKCIGGLVGKNYAAGKLINCYFAGSITGPEEGTYNFIGENAGTVENCYVVDTSGGKETAGVTAKASTYMKSDDFVVNLGASAFNRDTTENNGGYPILKWQGGSASENQDAVAVADAKAALKLRAKKGTNEYVLTAENYVYTIKPGDIDSLILPSTGEEETAITWTAAPEGVINPATGAVTAPLEGKSEVVLTAAISKGGASDTKEFKLSVWSAGAVKEEELVAYKTRLESFAIAASQIAHPEDTNVSHVVLRALAASGLDTTGLTATYTGVVEGTANNNIAPDGTITYFSGTTGRSVYFNNCIKVKLAKDGAETECILKQLSLSWDAAYVRNLLDGYRSNITWNSMKGSRKNEAQLDETGEIPIYKVNGNVDGTINLPGQAGGASVTWTAITGADNVTIGNVTFDSSVNQIYPCILTPSADKDVDVVLEATLTFNNLNDEDTVEGAVVPTSRIQIGFTIEQNDNPGVDKAAVQKALEEKYFTMLMDFYDKKTPVSPDAITVNIQMPTPGDLEKNGMMPDRGNEKIVMKSSDESVFELYGYQGKAYRPLPGESDKNVDLTVSIINRTNNSVIATTTRTLTVKAFTQEEIDTAAEEMKKVATDEVYTAGLLQGTKNSVNNVTENLNTYAEIWKTGSGYKYVKGKDGNFSFIKIDDIPGYDPMAVYGATWRTFRSSNENVLTHETLHLKKPEADTEITIDSVMSYVRYANYWEKFGESKTATDDTRARYAMFKQFYKIPVSVKVRVPAEHIHNMIHFPAKAPTETAAGNIEYWRCNDCGLYFADEEGNKNITADSIIIPKLAHKHKLVHHAAKKATTNRAGNIEYWKCSVCGKYYADKNGTKEISAKDIVIPKLAHKHKLVHHAAKKATTNRAGNIEYWKCSVCGKYYADKKGTKEISAKDIIIPRIKPEKVGSVFKNAGFQYRVTSSKASAPEVAIIKGASKSKVNIPASIKKNGITYKVTSIGDRAFSNNKAVTQVSGGANIKIIGEQAFSNCPKLKSFTVEKNVTWLSSKCFDGSGKLKTLTVKSIKLNKTRVKDSLEASNVKTIAVKVGSGSANKNYVTKYKKIFTKDVCGRKVTVK